MSVAECVSRRVRYRFLESMLISEYLSFLSHPLFYDARSRYHSFSGTFTTYISELNTPKREASLLHERLHNDLRSSGEGSFDASIVSVSLRKPKDELGISRRRHNSRWLGN